MIKGLIALNVAEITGCCTDPFNEQLDVIVKYAMGRILVLAMEYGKSLCYNAYLMSFSTSNPKSHNHSS
jgi:hypothetical protein